MLTDREFTDLTAKYMDMVYRVALNCVKAPADADDVTQNVMLRLCRARETFRGEEHVKAWLIRVAVNESKRLLSAPWRVRTVALDQAAAHSAAGAGEGRELLEAVAALPGKYRLPLYLHYYEGYRVEEIARLTGRLPSTIQTRLARGRERLKRMLTQEEQYE